MQYTSETRESLLTNLSHGDTRINGRGVREDGICGYSLIPTGDVEGWKP